VGEVVTPPTPPSPRNPPSIPPKYCVFGGEVGEDGFGGEDGGDGFGGEVSLMERETV